MKHDDALAIAYDLVEKLGPYCSRIEIAGSVRRGKPEVHDIELVCEPVMTPRKDIFGNPAGMWCALDQVTWADLGSVIKNGPRYKQVGLAQGINLDLFIVLPPAQWGVIFTIRTGPADFSKWCVTWRRNGGALPSDCHVRDGAVIRGGQAIPMPDEEDFLNFLGLGWIEPARRSAGWRVQA